MAALDAVGGYRSVGAWGRDRSPVDAAHGVDILFIATPDDVVADVAAPVRPVATTAVVHLSGSLGLDVLAGTPVGARCIRWSRCPRRPSAPSGCARASPSPWPVTRSPGRWPRRSGGNVVEVDDRRPRRLPRRRGHRRQPSGGPHGPGRAGGRHRRAAARRLRRTHAGRQRGRHRPRPARRPDRAGRPGRLGDGGATPRRHRRHARPPNRAGRLRRHGGAGPPALPRHRGRTRPHVGRAGRTSCPSVRS